MKISKLMAGIIIMNKYWLVLIVVFSVGFISSKCLAQDKKALVSLCRLPVESEVNETNTNFTDSYKFRISKDGKPIKVESFQSRFTDVRDVISCLSDWKFTGFSEKSFFFVYFKWEHGVGWSEMRVFSKNFSQTVTPK